MKELELTRGKVAFVDDDDFEKLSSFKWQLLKNAQGGYAVRTVHENMVQKIVWVHREILKTPENMLTDHIDGNGLNNQKSNLRVVSDNGNQQNQTHRVIPKSSEYPGVCWHSASQKWMTRIQINKKRYHIGVFENMCNANAAYKVACVVMGR